MPSLRELQTRAYAAIVKERDASLAAYVRGGQIPPATRVRVYRNNLHESARKTLAACYPVVVEIVGGSCFRNLARAYVARYPSRSGDLAGFGAEFPALLEALYMGGPHAYIPSVAALEWACAESGIAPDASALDLRRLQRIAPADFPRLRFELHPAVRIVSSAHPVLAIWRAHQSRDFEGLPANGEEHVLVYREGHRIVMQHIDAATATLLRGLQTGAPLLEAQRAAEQVAARFEPAAALRAAYAEGLVVGCRV